MNYTPTCFKNPDKLSCKDLILINCPRGLKKCIATERGLSDLYKLVVTIMNNTYKKLKPKIFICFTYKSFSNDSFRKALKQMVSNEDNGDGNFGIFNHLL